MGIAGSGEVSLWFLCMAFFLRCAVVEGAQMNGARGRGITRTYH